MTCNVNTNLSTDLITYYHHCYITINNTLIKLQSWKRINIIPLYYSNHNNLLIDYIIEYRCIFTQGITNDDNWSRNKTFKQKQIHTAVSLYSEQAL